MVWIIEDFWLPVIIFGSWILGNHKASSYLQLLDKFSIDFAIDSQSIWQKNLMLFRACQWFVNTIYHLCKFWCFLCQTFGRSWHHLSLRCNTADMLFNATLAKEAGELLASSPFDYETAISTESCNNRFDFDVYPLHFPCGGFFMLRAGHISWASKRRQSALFFNRL